MGKSRLLSLLIYLLLKLISLPPLVVSISCSGPCRAETTPSLQSGGCKQSGTLTCEGCNPSNSDPLCVNGESYPTYECSPTVTSSTPAKLTLNDFSQGGDGGGAPSCGGGYQPNEDRIVALSTGWYSGGTRCNKTIRVRANNGQSVDAKVVDECSSMKGCDDEHAGQRPCENNIVDGSNAVWDALGLNKEDGEENITWFMVD